MKVKVLKEWLEKITDEADIEIKVDTGNGQWEFVLLDGYALRGTIKGPERDSLGYRKG